MGRCGRIGEMMHCMSESLKPMVAGGAEPNSTSTDLQEVASGHCGVVMVRNTAKLSDSHPGECFWVG